MLSFRVFGDIRFISHRDTVRLFERAFIRAALPIRYSEGFNPHPRLAMLVPRPVGVASDEELLTVEFEGSMACQELLDALVPQLPEGIEMRDARCLKPRQRPRPEFVRYGLDVAEQEETDLSLRIRRVLDACELTVTRHKPGNQDVRHFDARPYIQDISLKDGTLELLLRVSDRGTVRPAEALGLLGFDPRAIQHRIRRLSVYLEENGKRAETLDDEKHGTLFSESSQRKNGHK